MTSFKPYILIVVVALIVGAIYFIDSNTVKRAQPGQGVTVNSRIDQSRNQEIKKTKEQGNNSSVTQSTQTSSSTRQFVNPLTDSTETKSKHYELAKEITTPDGFINTDGKPITVNELIGKKVILIDFWTYSCINCQRTTPYLNAWYKKYQDQGLVIIGVHTPEFEFEKKYDNVKAAVEKFGIKFPVVLDNDYSTWTAYKNRYWPRKYLIDIDGYVTYDHIGEGGYEETEQKIQEALKERLAVLNEAGTINQSVTKEISISDRAQISPETYFGSARNTQQKNFLFPNDGWQVTSEFAQNNSANASIVYNYTAKDVFLVAESGQESIVEVFLDGKSLGAEAGSDIIKTSDGKSLVKMKEARLYKIIQGNQSENHILKLIIQKPGLKAFAFTFG
ncbi:redoxin domain-containing protein [Candidatus Azambacteria bacterium]|nr:redoxin domain-containing protein [Candidatus Azambacteria bacterium]